MEETATRDDAQRRALRLIVTNLLANGHTTQGTIAAVQDASRRWGLDLDVVPNWDHTLLVNRANGQVYLDVPTSPTAVNMHVVAETKRTLTSSSDEAEDLGPTLSQHSKLKPYSDPVFALACMTGATALAIIFGSRQPLELAIIAVVAGIGGLVRRQLGRFHVSLVGQALGAALIAGITASAVHAGSTTNLSLLVALCPAMVLVPGPHLLNGLLDLAGLHIGIGIGRLTYALTILAAICAGLILGLIATGGLPPSNAAVNEPTILVDTAAAAVAGASYSVYFGLRPRHLIWPVAIGAFAHVVRYVLLYQLDYNGAVAAFAACLVTGLLLTPVAHRMHLPFAGIGFASVVALVPGVLVFRATSGIVELANSPTTDLLLATASDLANALLTMLAMGAGLVIAHRLAGRWWVR